MPRPSERRAAMAGAPLLLLLLGGAAPVNEYQALLQKNSEAIVTLRYVLEVKMFGGDKGEESENQISGVMIDPEGLVLCSDAVLGGMITALRGMFMPFGGVEQPLVSTTDIKVFVGKEAEGLPATLLTRDSELDLAWIRVENPGKRRFAYVDLKKSAEAEVGQRLLSLWRKGRAFDAAIMVGEGRVAGMSTKPRQLYFPGGDLGSVLGLPVFNTAGQVVGVSVLYFPDAGADASKPNPAEIMSSFFRMPEIITGSILPAAEVIRATEQAKKSVGEKK